MMGSKQKIEALSVALNEAEQDKAITEAAFADLTAKLEKVSQDREAAELAATIANREAQRLRDGAHAVRAREAKAKAEKDRQETLDNLRKGLVSVAGADVSFHHGSDPGVTIEVKLDAQQAEALEAFVKRPAPFAAPQTHVSTPGWIEELARYAYGQRNVLIP